jgi:hypothetical protein
MSGTDREDRDGEQRDDHEAVPDRYAASADEPLTAHISGTVAPGTKQFLEDVVDTHEEYSTVAAVLRDQVNALKREKGEAVAELKDVLEENRRQL